MVTITTTTTTEPTMSIILRKTTSISLRVNSVPTGSDRPLVGALDQATSVAGDHFPPEDLLQVQVWARDHPGHPPSKPSGRLWGAHWGARGGWLEWKIERNWNSQNCRQGQGRKRWNKDLRSASSTSNSGKNQEHSWTSPQHWWPQSPPCQRWWKDESRMGMEENMVKSAIRNLAERHFTSLHFFRSEDVQQPTNQHTCKLAGRSA